MARTRIKPRSRKTKPDRHDWRWWSNVLLPDDHPHRAAVVIVLCAMTLGAISLLLMANNTYQSQKLLDAVRAKTAVIFDRAPVTIMMLDETGRIVMVNGMVKPMFGYKPSELVNTNFDRLLDKQFRQVHATAMRRFLAKMKTDDGVTEARCYAHGFCLTKNGRKVFVFVSVCAIKHNGRTEFIAVLRPGTATEGQAHVREDVRLR